jgi:TetR/AcrR family transcriptional regulator, cholesterol catabolism regulator
VALRERYDRRQRDLVTRAADVFATRGYDQSTMQDVAEASGLATGALYHYFKGKEELLAAICDELVDPLVDEAEHVIAQHANPREQLVALVRAWVAHVVDHRDNMLVFQQERHLIERGERWRSVRTARKRFERLVDNVLQRVDEAGILTTTDRRLALSALLGMVNHTAQWYRPSGRLSATEIADGYVRLLLD